MESFSFITHPVIGFMNDVALIFPGLGKIVGIFEDGKTGRLIGKLYLKNNSELQDIDLSNAIANIQKINESNLNTPKWLSIDEVPFEIQNKKTFQKEIFEELDHIVLQVIVSNPSKIKKDLLYFYFNKNVSNFGISNSAHHLNTEHKAIIGFIINNLINFYYKNHEKNNRVLQIINSNTKALIKNAEMLKDEIIQTKSHYGQSLINLSDVFLIRHTEKITKKFSFDDTAYEKIRNYQGSIQLLEKVISNAISFALSLYPNDNYITLKEWHLNFNDFIAEKSPEFLRSFSEDKEQKATVLLNKLENAAHKVIAKKMKLTSKNVGKECPRPISAPAITDALSKHRNKIFDLLQKYPDKWSVLRANFRPLQNVIYSKNDILPDTA